MQSPHLLDLNVLAFLHRVDDDQEEVLVALGQESLLQVTDAFFHVHPSLEELPEEVCRVVSSRVKTAVEQLVLFAVADEVDGLVHDVFAHFYIADDRHDVCLQRRGQLVLDNGKVLRMMADLLQQATVENVDECLDRQFEYIAYVKLALLLCCLCLAACKPEFLDLPGHAIGIRQQHHEVRVAHLVKNAVSKVLSDQ